MPTYEYLCGSCEHTFDEFQSIKAVPLKKCPECGKPKLKRLIGTGAGVIFKGSGFYETDYRSESYKSAAKADADKSSGKSSETSDGKAGAKTDAKADSGASKSEAPSAAKADASPSTATAPAKATGKSKKSD